MCANGCVLVIARVQNGVVYLTTHSVCLYVCMYVLSMCVDIFRFLALDKTLIFFSSVTVP